MSLILNGTTGLSGVDGSSGTPALQGNDSNTGVSFGTDTVTINTGGTARVTTDASGNVGIGTVSPAQKLHVSGGNARIDRVGGASILTLGGAPTDNWESDLVFYSSNGVKNWRVASNRVLSGGFTITPSTVVGGDTFTTPAFAIDSSGNVGIGTVSPATRLEVSSASPTLRITDTATAVVGGTYGTLEWKSSDPSMPSSGIAGKIDVFDDASAFGDRGAMRFYTNNATSLGERMRIDSSGNLLVGSTTDSPTSGAGIKFSPSTDASQISIVGSASTNDNVTYRLYSTGASAYRFFVGLGGTVYATSATISALSDARLKENISDLDVGLNAVLALKPRKFDWKDGKGADKKGARGFIAQEFETVFPDLIDEWKDPMPEGESPYKSVRQDLIPVLVKAIQEQQALITQLQADVAALKGAA